MSIAESFYATKEFDITSQSLHQSRFTMASQTIVLITGGNTGIGFETAKALLRSDKAYHVLLGGRDLAKAEAAAESARAEIHSGSVVEPFQVDVEDDQSITKAFDLVSSKHSRIDCLINNAGTVTNAEASITANYHRRQLRRLYRRRKNDSSRGMEQRLECVSPA